MYIDFYFFQLYCFISFFFFVWSAEKKEKKRIQKFSYNINSSVIFEPAVPSPHILLDFILFYFI